MISTRRKAMIGGVSLSAIGAAGGIGWSRIRPKPEIVNIDAVEVYDRVRSGSVLLLDIRRPEEWALTGLADGAVPLDMRRRDFIEALSALAGPDRSQPVALICAAGVRSAHMARQLEQAGFTTILNVPEGMTGSSAGPGWLRRGLPRVAWDESA